MVVMYKLLSGEEVVAKELSNEGGIIVLGDPIALVYHENGQGTVSIGFAPFMPQSKGNVSLYHTSIAAFAEPSDQITSEYTRVTSGIVLAGADSLK